MRKVLTLLGLLLLTACVGCLSIDVEHKPKKEKKQERKEAKAALHHSDMV